MLYATPQEGSQIAAIAKNVANNPALADMLPADANAFLQQLNDEWKSLPKRPPVICAYEKLSTHGVLIVPWSSATRFCDGATTAVDADHISIVKPDRLEHPSVVVLVNALNRYVIGKELTAKLETPDFVPEGDHLVFLLSDPVGKNTARLVNAGRAKLTFTFAQLSDPHLFLWPDDTPREITARQTHLMRAGLGFGATAVEYRFVLQSNVSKDQVVVVRVTNLPALAKKQAGLLGAVAADINGRLRDPAVIKRLKEESKTEAEAELVGIVRNAIARDNPELPESAQWVLAASLLNAANWPGLATTALRRAEAVSPATAKSSSARWLAGAIAAQSGIERVFATAETPKVKLDDVPKPQLVGRLVERGQTDAFFQVASGLQQIPTLKPYGFSLEGDIWAARGNKQAAHAAYNSAAFLGVSPSLHRRMSDLEWRGPTPKAPADTRPSAPRSTTDTPGTAVERNIEPTEPSPTKIPFRSGNPRNAEPSTDGTR
jgi:hypothetical protein